MHGQAAIDVKGLKKDYGEVKALAGLDLVVESDQVFGLLGPNGAGKTTLISILTGLQKATAGECKVLGNPISERQASVKSRVGVCPQSGAIYQQLTGVENVVLFGRLYGLSKEESENKANGLLARVGLESDAGRKAGTYSEGMKRRLSLVMALVHSPELTFLDEPTVGMDPQSRRAVWDIVREQKGLGRTVVLTTHYMEEAEQLCDTVGIIDHGELIALGSPSGLMSKYCKDDLEEVFIHLTGRGIREEI